MERALIMSHGWLASMLRNSIKDMGHNIRVD